jgi:hypothetical protein
MLNLPYKRSLNKILKKVNLTSAAFTYIPLLILHIFLPLVVICLCHCWKKKGKNLICGDAVHSNTENDRTQ